MYLAITIQLSIICIIQSAAQTDTQDCSGCCTSAGGIPGIPGIHGTPGAPGPVGMKGDVGVKGEKGNQGTDGLQGKIGPTGLPGTTGEKGVMGNHGLPGEKGERGEMGNQGLDGRDGPPGKIGPIGLPGATGKKGDMGNQGLDGRDGLPGEIGPIGLPGAIGEKGERGEKGEQAATKSQPKSAFLVAYNSDPGRLPVSPMKYPLIITNFGNHYNKDTGKFVCQHPGIYVFQFTSQSNNGGKIITTIRKNGQVVVSSWEGGSSHKSVSNMVLLDLVANDEVWTQPFSTSYNYYYSDSDNLCSFSGFLLYASS